MGMIRRRKTLTDTINYDSIIVKSIILEQVAKPSMPVYYVIPPVKEILNA